MVTLLLSCRHPVPGEVFAEGGHTAARQRREGEREGERETEKKTETVSRQTDRKMPSEQRNK